MYSIEDIKKAQNELNEAKARPVSSFFSREESFFDDVPETKEEAKAQLVAEKEQALKRAFANVSSQKEMDRYEAENGIFEGY